MKDPFTRVVLLDHRIVRNNSTKTGEKIRINLRAIFSRVRDPKHKPTQIPLDITGVRAEVVLYGEQFAIDRYAVGKEVVVDWRTKGSKSSSVKRTKKGGVTYKGFAAEAGQERDKASAAELEQSGRGKVSVVTASRYDGPPRAVRWTYRPEPGVEPYLDGDEEPWVEVTTKAPLATRVQAEARILDWIYVDSNGSTYTGIVKMGLFARIKKLFGGKIERYSCLDPVMVEIPLDK